MIYLREFDKAKKEEKENDKFSQFSALFKIIIKNKILKLLPIFYFLKNFISHNYLKKLFFPLYLEYFSNFFI